jgi:hemerythrin-like domain-containing protein
MLYGVKGKSRQKEVNMSATDVLKDEHRGVERMLAIVEAASNRLAAGGDVPTDLYLNAVDFFRGFTDGCHHTKEETKLFPAMEQRGIPHEGGPIGVMLAEHDLGRTYVRTMAEAAQRYSQGDPLAASGLVQSGRGYVGLLRQHIAKEDGILFPMADKVLSMEEQAQLSEDFEVIEREKTGPGEHERYHHMLDELERVVAAW